jgi:hypothetical protein
MIVMMAIRRIFMNIFSLVLVINGDYRRPPTIAIIVRTFRSLSDQMSVNTSGGRCRPHCRPTNIRFSMLPFSSSLRSHLHDAIVVDTLICRTRDGQTQHDGREELLHTCDWITVEFRGR